ncbi:MAG: hypothetical protein AB7H96_16755 [Vicinamibacterales bacterium]
MSSVFGAIGGAVGASLIGVADDQKVVAEPVFHDLPGASGLQCPRCASRDVHRSRTRVWERPIRFLTPLLPFRCYACRWRGWRRPPHGRDSEPELIHTEG